MGRIATAREDSGSPNKEMRMARRKEKKERVIKYLQYSGLCLLSHLILIAVYEVDNVLPIFF